MSQKIKERLYWKEVRGSISTTRRLDASKGLLASLQEKFAEKKVLSFASFGTELDTRAINARLASQGALFLPRVEGSALQIYLVKNLEKDLIPSKFGPNEPDPPRCLKVDPTSLDVVLVPGLAFDASHHRLGYGQGHYDRFLKNSSLLSIGVGFFEQKTEKLAADSWDIPLNQVLYF